MASIYAKLSGVDIGGGTTGQKTAGAPSRRSLIQGTMTSALAIPVRSLSSAALVAALSAASLLPSTALFIVLSAATALFVTITLFIAIALFSAPALLAPFLSGSRGFDRFIRIALCFHGIFLCLVAEFTNWCAQESALIAENTQSGWRMIVQSGKILSHT